MKFTIIGAGAIGGVTGAFLSRAGHDITFVDIAGEHVDAINEQGLKIKGHTEFSVKARAIRPQQLAAPLGHVIMAVKSHHTEQAVAPLDGLLGPDEYVLSMQNGLEEHKIARVVGPERTVGCFLTFGAHYAAPGEVVYGGPGTLCIGELDGCPSDRLVALQQALSVLQPITVTDNIFGFLWAKLALGSIYFATALVDADVPEIFDHPNYRPILEHVCGEAVAVAEAVGVIPEVFDGFDCRVMRLSGDDRAGRDASWDGQRRYWDSHVQKRTGIWRDLAVRKRKTEADSLLGTVLREADRAGVAVPANRTVHRMIKEIEAGQRSMGWANLDEVHAVVGQGA